MADYAYTYAQLGDDKDVVLGFEDLVRDLKEDMRAAARLTADLAVKNAAVTAKRTALEAALRRSMRDVSTPQTLPAGTITSYVHDATAQTVTITIT